MTVTPLPGTRQGEVIVGGDGRWLGGFTDEMWAPVLPCTGAIEMPTGWTNAGWTEQDGRIFEKHLVCDDCCPPNPHNCPPDVGCHTAYGFRWAQKVAGQPIPCDQIIRPNLYDYGITPMCCGTGDTVAYDTSRSCCCVVPCVQGKCVGVVSNAGVNYSAAGWPLVPYGVALPSAAARVVSDATGPEGLEDYPALEIDFSGTGSEGAVFVGEGGGYDSNRPPFAASNPAAIDIFGNDRTMPFWEIAPGSCWTVSFYYKSVPDDDGVTVTGWQFTAKASMGNLIGHPVGQNFTNINNGGEEYGLLGSDWQHYLGYTTWDPTGPPFGPACLSLLTPRSGGVKTICPPSASNGFASHTVNHRRGRVHVKAVEVYPCNAYGTGDGLHIWHRGSH